MKSYKIKFYSGDSILVDVKVEAEKYVLNEFGAYDFLDKDGNIIASFDVPSVKYII